MRLSEAASFEGVADCGVAGFEEHVGGLAAGVDDERHAVRAGEPILVDIFPGEAGGGDGAGCSTPWRAGAPRRAGPWPASVRRG